MKHWFLMSVVLVAGCGGAPRAAAPSTSGAAEQPSPTAEAEKAPPAATQALSAVDVELDVYNEFVDVEVARLRPRHLSDDELTRLAPAALRGRFKKLLGAPDELTRSSSAAWDKQREVDECSETSCPKEKALEAAWKRADDALQKSYERLEKTRSQLVQALEKNLEARPTVGAALVLARVEELDEPMSNVASRNMPAESGQSFGELSEDNAMRGSLPAVEAYRRAAKLAGSDARLAAWAHYGAATHLFAQAEGEAALAELQAAASSAPANLAREIHARVALLHAATGDYPSAIEALERAMKAPGSVPGDSDLSAMTMLARYRNGELDEALRAAVQSIQTPATRDAARITPYGRERIAVDCLERLKLDALDRSGAAAETKALLLGQLAQRRFFRDDTEGAAPAAHAGVDAAPNAGEARVAYLVLEKLARAAGRSDEAEQWKTKGASLGRIKFWTGAISVLGQPVEADERKYLEGKLENAGSMLQRRVASVTRLCLEPSFAQVASGNGPRVVTLRISVQDDGRARSLLDEGHGLSSFSDCLAEQVPRVFRNAPHSVNAKLDLEHVGQSFLSAKLTESMKHGPRLEDLLGSGQTSGSDLDLDSHRPGAGGGGSAAGVVGLGTRHPKKPPPKKKKEKP